MTGHARLLRDAARLSPGTGRTGVLSAGGRHAQDSTDRRTEGRGGIKKAPAVPIPRGPRTAAAYSPAFRQYHRRKRA